MVEFDEGDVLNRNTNVKHNNRERRFSDMSRQIGEITNIVLSLTERLSSNTREGNGLNTLSFDPNGRSVEWLISTAVVLVVFLRVRLVNKVPSSIPGNLFLTHSFNQYYHILTLSPNIITNLSKLPSFGFIRSLAFL